MHLLCPVSSVFPPATGTRLPSRIENRWTLNLPVEGSAAVILGDSSTKRIKLSGMGGYSFMQLGYRSSYHLAASTRE
jgi:hypothetical protein